MAAIIHSHELCKCWRFQFCWIYRGIGLRAHYNYVQVCPFFLDLDKDGAANRSSWQPDNVPTQMARTNFDSTDNNTLSPTNAIKTLRDRLNTIFLQEPISTYLTPVEKATKIKRENLIFGFLVIFLCTYLIFGFGNSFVCNILIGFFYPAYASIMAVEFTATNNYLRWLVYWIVYTFFGFIEYLFSGFLESLYVYWLLKCGFLLWLMIPGTDGGAYLLYHRFIRRLLLSTNKQHSTWHYSFMRFCSIYKQLILFWNTDFLYSLMYYLKIVVL